MEKGGLAYVLRRSTLLKNRALTTSFSYAELERATGGFSEENLVGSGGSSDVYRGRLTDGRFVAIKSLNWRDAPIELISKLNHRHVVPLLGYCVERRQKSSQRLLVLEYMPNGSLRDSLDVQSGGKPIDWGARVGIALGVARGLEYLHEAAAPRILHRDVKSGNILLDDLFTAKITDLGMAKRLTSGELAGCSSSPARMLGTFGYFAPECAITGRASLKSDVFSFGVVVLELITGRRPIHRAKNQGEESLVIWAAPLLRSSKLAPSELPDPLLRGKCLQWDADSRPSMSEVVQVLSAIAPGRPRRRTLSTSVTMSSSPDIGESGSEAELELRGVNPGVTRATALTAITVLTPPRRWTADDEESVDLTEPQFKSFIQEVVCITIQ
ncbi:unnamed protein product [Spirodela intermedia]|uniref:non-specific serine/threonine protein kinase n=1 Tax=Spirodela intermedia TaxID=51605 RepID=A0A7I8IZK1_SPIIN|nr:unnamed protein product [Spirodela intermedia]CAA6662460.1 unnamed protein product [Spirodela intermedia]